MKKIDVVFDVWSHNEGVPIRKDLEACLRAIGVDPEEEIPAPAKPEADVGFVQPPAPQAAGEEPGFDAWWDDIYHNLSHTCASHRQTWDAASRRARETWAEEKERLQTKCANLEQQASGQAQQARTQRRIVIDILRALVLPERDWEAVEAVTAHVKVLRADRDRLETETKRQRGLLLWLLWHHQGGNSDVGQPIRTALGIGRYARLTSEQVEEARAAAPAWTLAAQPPAPTPDLAGLVEEAAELTALITDEYPGEPYRWPIRQQHLIHRLALAVQWLSARVPR